VTITNEMMSSLKRTNVSKDADKTKDRVKADFLAARNKHKTAIDELSGLKRTSVYRVFREGAISPKIVLAMAQVLNVSPYYYTGEVDEKGECTVEQLHSFVAAKGFRELAYKIAPGRRDTASAVQSKPAVTPASGDPLFPSEFSNSPELAEAAAGLSVEEAQQLLAALLIRARTGGNAARLADLVKRCLLL
jgi:hypothetical protein